ncbi:MAG TPA: PRC-barrel domain-containing protein, partial [Smithellaceae bacterium]
MAVNYEPQVFLFLSRILGKKIVGAMGETLGRVYDLTAEFVEPYPVVTGLIFSSAQKRNPVFLPWKDVVDLAADVSVAINSTRELSTLNLRQGELLLKDDLLDKQVVDTDGAKIRRVNDLQFLKTSHGLHLVHVDVGF